MIYDVELKKQRLVISDNELLKLVEQRFKFFTDKWKIEKGCVLEYKRAKGCIMFGWHHADDQSDENYQRVKKVYDLIDALKNNLFCEPEK